MALDNVTSYFYTMLETIASASFLSSLSIIHVDLYRPFWIFMEVSADNSFPDFRSPFPAPRSPLPAPRSPLPVPRSPFPRFSNIRRSSREIRDTSVLNEFGTFLKLSNLRSKILLRLTLFTLFTANGYNFSIFTVID